VRSALAAILGLGLLALAGHWLLGGPGFRSGSWLRPSYLATLAGLATVALGAVGAALASAVPGREAAARLGARTAAVGFVLAVGGGIVGLASDTALWDVDLGACLSCIRRALGLGIAPTLAACAFILYAAVRRPRRGTALALAGGVALGAAAIHSTCPSDSPLHWILAHALAPVAAIGVFTIPLAALIARVVRR
jgi:hypothetical protein